MSNLSHVDKPSWLRSFLDNLQFQIFTWHIDVGGPIETAFDWLFAPLNFLIDWLNWVLNWVEQAFDWVMDRVRAFFDPWIYVIREIYNTISTWWSSLGDWFSGLVSDIHDWVDARLQNFKDGFSIITDRLSDLWNLVSHFFSSILPDLASRLDVSNAIAAALIPWRDLFNFWGSFGRELVTLVTNPVAFIWSKFTDWFFGG
jgi:phage-related protein